MRKGLTVIAFLALFYGLAVLGAQAGWIAEGRTPVSRRSFTPLAKAWRRLADLRSGPPAVAVPARPFAAAASSVAVPRASTVTVGAATPRGPWGSLVAALAALERGERQTDVRILQLGDSELVADGPSRRMRRAFRARYGDGGPGFTLAARPVRWYDHEVYRHQLDPDVEVYSFVHGALLSGDYGPGGVAMVLAARQRLMVERRGTRPRRCVLRLFFARQPGGGRAVIRADGRVLTTVDTAFSRVAQGEAEAVAEPCPRELEVSAEERSVRLHGWEVDDAAPGIQWSTLGVVGARLEQLRNYPQERLEEALVALRPDLLILNYGINRAASNLKPAPTYVDELGETLGRLRRGLPGTACLVVGPYPVGRLGPDGALPRGARWVSEAQAEAARRNRCQFIDRYRLAGGAEAALQWRRARPRLLAGDFQHLTNAGSEAMGDAMADVLFAVLEGRPVQPRALSLGGR